MELEHQISKDLVMRVEKLLNEVFEELYQMLIAKSPVYTGEYAQSHHIDNHGLAMDYESNPQPGAVKTLSYKWKIDDNVVCFYNTSGHADVVEYIGWPQSGKPPYAVYTTTLSTFETVLAKKASKYPGLELGASDLI